MAGANEMFFPYTPGDPVRRVSTCQVCGASIAHSWTTGRSTCDAESCLERWRRDAPKREAMRRLGDPGETDLGAFRRLSKPVLIPMRQSLIFGFPVRSPDPGVGDGER